MPLYDIASLWIGAELTWLEQVCLQSYLDAGHRTVLYSYAPVAGVPDGVEMLDAREIMPEEDIVYHVNTGSPAFHADIFRLRMLAKTDFLWVDTDAYCLEPFVRADHGYFFGWGSDKRKILYSGVLGLPKSSQTLQGMLDLTKDMYPIPPWATPERQDELRALKEQGKGVHMSLMQWGICGPEALHYFANATGEVKYAFEPEVLYPIPFSNTRSFHRPHLKRVVEASIDETTLSVHFYGRRFRNIFAQTGGMPPEGSYAHEVCEKHRIDPSPTAHLFEVKAPGKVSAAKS